MKSVDQIAARFADLGVDVREENPGAGPFHAALGLAEIGRSEWLGEGQPHPILHLRRHVR
ncbi:GNAT family N-acetyltransferase [Microbacterium sp.]|uniref:GNAT family N-acetyltransferase n=1 Tax=Microbacterium sp. TaxID=51671 RepID=UPI003C745D14